MKHLSNMIDGRVLLVVSRALAALRPALIAFLLANAAQLSGGATTPLSFCNVLFVGNLCAAMTVIAWFGLRPIVEDLLALDKKVLVGLLLNGCVAAALSSFIFLGLQHTQVTNAVLLGRLGPVLFALAGSFVFGMKLRWVDWVGFALIITGVLAIVFQTNNFQINRGDIYILLSAVTYAVSLLLGKLMLTKSISLRLLVFSRNFVAAIVFFIIAMMLFGPSHFGDVFSGQLWIIMAIYALLIIVVAQFLWYAALERLDAKTVGKWTLLTPVFGITYAFLLNGERPSREHVLAFIVIMIGVATMTLTKKPTPDKADQELMGEAESSMTAN
ncbi:DMT family transporter [filamentous cyanobacterium LEGE 11480]|uniref:DMT family transporter n=1 Tax=Romeriopsis navalis LEGE 11480 TaxID=2777977 RepID=A0A928Z0F4_9CYAN|nr:DMT family transporter [Romeriopsis navalis]MBE9028216.1 DMT family transporter [Romeriopsis navalis LEGE 11480]